MVVVEVEQALLKRHTNIPYKRYNLLCADKLVGWKLYGERKGGVKTTDILEFYAVIHKSNLIKDKIENDSNKLLYSVPYHPETNSIEEFFSQLKHYI